MDGLSSSPSLDGTSSISIVTSADETTSIASADESITVLTVTTGTTVPLSRPVEPKSRVEPVWRLPIWDIFSICGDKKFAKCEECSEVVKCGVDSAKTFTTTNLVSHLRTNHPVVYQRFCKSKDSQRQDVRKERVESGFTALRQLTLRGSEDHIKIRMGHQ